MDGEWAVFAGSYDRSDRLFLTSLTSMHAEDLLPQDGDGKVLRFQRAFGRGKRLFLATEQTLFMINLDDIRPGNG